MAQERVIGPEAVGADSGYPDYEMGDPVYEAEHRSLSEHSAHTELFVAVVSLIFAADVGFGLSISLRDRSL